MSDHIITVIWVMKIFFVQFFSGVAERSYSMFKVRRGNLVQGKEQRLRFAGADVKRYPTSKVRETQVRQ